MEVKVSTSSLIRQLVNALDRFLNELTINGLEFQKRYLFPKSVDR
jgi:hypothetical protein